MTVTASYTPVLDEADGVETDYDFGFKALGSSDVVVALVDKITLVATPQSISTHYTVELNVSTPGGTIKFLSAPADTNYVSIRRDVAVTQTADIPSGGLFREVQVENALDKAIMILQELQEAIGRALLQSPYSSTVNLALPIAVANKIIGWDATGTALENKIAIDADVVAAAAASASEAAGYASSANTSKTNAETAETNAETAETNAETAQTAAEAAASDAATYSSLVTLNAQTDNYTLVLTDRNKLVDMNKATAVNLTIPLNSSVEFPVGSVVNLRQLGAGQVTIVATGGVTIVKEIGLQTTGQYAVAALLKTATDTWLAYGALEA